MDKESEIKRLRRDNARLNKHYRNARELEWLRRDNEKLRNERSTNQQTKEEIEWLKGREEIERLKLDNARLTNQWLKSKEIDQHCRNMGGAVAGFIGLVFFGFLIFAILWLIAIT